MKLALPLAFAAFFIVGKLSAEPIKARAVDARFQLAVSMLSEGRVKEADALFVEILNDNDDPAQLQAALGRASIAMSRQRVAEADSSISAVLLKRPDMPEAHNMKGVVLLLQKQPDAARAAFTRAIKLNPRYVTPHLHLAMIARGQGDLATAAAEYETLMNLAPRLPNGYIGKAEVLMLQRDNTGAYKVLNAWKAADPKSILVYHVLANVYVAEKNPTSAMDELNAALAKEPKNPTTLIALGDLHASTGQWKLASDRYLEAMAVDLTDVTAELRLGGAWIAQGNRANALATYRRVLSTDPNNVIASNNVAWLLLDEPKSHAEALRLAMAATKGDPAYVDAFDTLGWVHYARGEFAESVAALQKAKSLSGGRPDISAHLGLALAKLGRNKEALDELTFALSKGGRNLPNRAEAEKTAAVLGPKR